MSRRRNSGAILAVTTSIVAIGAGSALAVGGPGTSRSSSTTVSPYVLPVTSGVSIKSLFTVGDLASPDGYRMVGIPDGLGVARQSLQTMNVYMNHELRPDQGVVRRHGQAGAFVSKLTVGRGSQSVLAGEDLIDPGVRFWDYPSQTYGTNPSAGGANPREPGDTFIAQIAAFSRFCSAAFSDPGQFASKTSSKGTFERIYLTGEEAGDEGRAFGVLENGQAQQLQRLGLFSWENALPAPNRSDRTLLMGQEDTATGQLWAYHGAKQSRGNAFDRAGLTNGTNTVIDVVDESVSTDEEFRAQFGTNTPARVDLSTVDWDQSGAEQNREAAVKGLTLNRIEDGAWDPRNRNDFYFVTTEGGDTTPRPGTTTSRDGGGLWRMRFDDIENPELGGSLTLLLDGSEAPYLNKPDNMDIDKQGNILIQEDPGNNPQLARIVAYRIADGARGVLAEFDPALFAPATPGGTDAVLTTDEESSGIIDISELYGNGMFLFDAQVHKNNPDPELVQEGQLMTMKVEDFSTVYTIGGQPAN